MSTEKEDRVAKKIIDEIYDIREKIYEKIKGMSPEEHVAYFTKSTEKIEARLGVKFRKEAPPRHTVLAEH